MPGLSARILRKIETMFASDEQSSAEQWLIAECGVDLPGLGNMNLERIQAAVVKLSVGSLDRLAEATRLARSDWRDALMAADFGNVDAHEAWLDATK